MRLPRFYPILDSQAIHRTGLPLVAAGEALLEAGVEIIQLRHKGSFDRSTYDDAKRISSLCRLSQVMFVVNDRTDIALLADAAVHLGQDDLPPSDARAMMGAGRVIGFSTHNEHQLRSGDAEPVDYLALGPIFGTASKEKPDPSVGVAELMRLRCYTSKPLVAIGGITRTNAAEVWGAGADSVAVIADLLSPELNVHSLRRRAEEWLALTKR